MTDSLRTRIIAAIAKHYPGMDYDGVDGDCSGCDFYLNRDPGWEWEKHSAHLADAVIRELGLREEQRDLMDGECGQSINYMTGKVTNHYRAATRQSRYVTEWETDE